METEISDACKHFLDDVFANLTHVASNVEIVQLAAPGMHAIIYNNIAVIYVMTEYTNVTSNKELAQYLHQVKPEAQLLMVARINPDDYNKANAFATVTRNLFGLAFSNNNTGNVFTVACVHDLINVVRKSQKRQETRLRRIREVAHMYKCVEESLIAYDTKMRSDGCCLSQPEVEAWLDDLRFAAFKERVEVLTSWKETRTLRKLFK